MVTMREMLEAKRIKLPDLDPGSVREARQAEVADRARVAKVEAAFIALKAGMDRNGLTLGQLEDLLQALDWETATAVKLLQNYLRYGK